MTFTVDNEQLARLKQQNYNRAQNNIGRIENPYLMKDHEWWIEKQFPVDSFLDPETQEANQLFRTTHDLCMDVIEEYWLDFEPRSSGPTETEQNYAAHGLRVGRIMVEELGFNNPYMYAHAVLHDVIEVINKRAETPEDAHIATQQFKEYFRQRTEDVFGTSDNILANLPEALEEFYYRDLIYDLLAEETLENPEIRAMMQQGLDQGFTPQSYNAFRKKVIDTYIHERKSAPEKGRYPDLRELIEFMKFNITDSDTTANTPDGLAVMMTMVAQAADNFRYPKEDTQEYYCMQGIDVICNLLPMLRGLNHQAGIRMLYPIPARAFMPEQWAACRTALEALSHLETDDEKNGIFFDKQAEKSIQIIYRIVNEMSQYLEQQGVSAIYVDSAELERRKIQLLAGQLDGPLLRDHEFSIIGPSKKTAGSIFTKLFLEYPLKKDNRFGEWVEGATPEEQQAALAELFKDPDTWVHALARSPDTLRATIVLGDELSQLYCYGDEEKQIPPLNTLFKFYFPEDLEEQEDARSINTDIRSSGSQDNSAPNHTVPDHFRPIHHHNNRRISRSESIESRFYPYRKDANGRHLFEDHYVMKLRRDRVKQDGGLEIHLPFELHIESVEEHYLDELDKEAHILYKSRYILPEMTEEDDKELLQNYRDVLLLMYWCMYSEAFDGNLVGHYTHDPTKQYDPADYYARYTEWIEERQQRRFN